jgi:hypothetical protein
MNSHSWRLLPLLLLLLTPLAMPASGQPISPTEEVRELRETIQGLALLPSIIQTQEPCQKPLRRWFLARVREYAQTLVDTHLGQAVPGIIVMDELASRATTLLSPPSGPGVTILFNAAHTARVPEKGPPRVEFPWNGAAEYIDGFSGLNTCWHEIQHVLFMQAENPGKALWLDISAWNRFRKPPLDDYIDHVYIEALAEHTIEWLDLLLHDKTKLGNGAGLGFERKAIAAGSRARELSRAGTPPDYFVEHALWAQAHDAWVRGWDRARLIAPLPPDAKAVYQEITGVRIGAIQEVIHFFTRGGLITPDGDPILVPPWVLMRGITRSPVLVEIEPDPAIITRFAHFHDTHNLHHHHHPAPIPAVGFRLLRHFRFKSHNSPFLNRGVLTIRLQKPDAKHLLTAVISGSGCQRLAHTPGNLPLVIDLTDCPQDSRGTILVRPVAPGSDPGPISLMIEFQDQRPPVHQPGGEVRYYAVKSYFLTTLPQR